MGVPDVNRFDTNKNIFRTATPNGQPSGYKVDTE